MSVMESADDRICSKRKHIEKINRDYTGSPRLLQSFVNLSNTVIQTALSGQTKFIFEILQNADDAFEDPNEEIEVTFILQDDYFIVQHNGKGFDYNDVERICDYASQIEEVKATDLSKTGYKGLGFKSVFNFSDSIYLYSNGYCFRFNKMHRTDWHKMPWQIIPIWCQYDELPLHATFPYDEPVNIIMKINDVNQLEDQLKELIGQPDSLLFLNRIKKVNLNLKGNTYNFKITSEIFGKFFKMNVFNGEKLVSTWLSITYDFSVPENVKELVQIGDKITFPDKIKTADKVQTTFAVPCNEDMKSISSIKNLLFSTLPTQIDISLPYHINSFFILNLDRSQLLENKWNELLMKKLGSLHPILLKDIAGIDYIKNDVISIFRRKINHPLPLFCQAYSKGFLEKSSEIRWLPSFRNTGLLRLNEAWIDETEFFKQNFRYICDDKKIPFLISYELKNQITLCTTKDQVKRFNYQNLFKDFTEIYSKHLTKTFYSDFISYIYMKLKDRNPQEEVMKQLKKLRFLISKKKTLVAIEEAIIEEKEKDIPDFLKIDKIVDKNYLPEDKIDLIVEWFGLLGSRKPNAIDLLRESVLNWISNNSLHHHMNLNNHIQIIKYLSHNIDILPVKEFEKLKDGLILLTESNEFNLAKKCQFADAVPTEVLKNVLSKTDIISSSYVLNELKDFFVMLGVCEKLKPIDVVRRSIFTWINNNSLDEEVTTENYHLIINYIAEIYPELEKELTPREKTELKKMPILTSENTFQEAKSCYFDSVIPDVNDLVDVIPKNQVILKNTLSQTVIEFLQNIGVSDKLEPAEVIRKTVLHWITVNEIRSRVTIENHGDIIKYIVNNWNDITFGISKKVLNVKEKESLKKFPLLTEGESFREAEDCYWQFCTLGGKQQKIPNLDSVISNEELVSTKYDLEMYKQLFNELGVQKPAFTNIYEKYSNHLNNSGNAQWFLHELTEYWKMNNNEDDILLNRLKDKFSLKCCLLAKNGEMHRSSSLYHSRFSSIDDIFPCLLPLLSYDRLPSDLEDWLGFKSTLELDCIVKLLKALSESIEIGQEKTKSFFTTLLEQLKQMDESKIKQYSLSLLSKENKLKSAKELYYFQEEDATCELNSCYLKRIHGMSHEETLELAELCGVNILPYEKNITLENEKIDDTLKEFYMVRLPFIVALEAVELNENPQVTLRRLYDRVSSIQLYQCQKIQVQYPFGHPVLTRLFYDKFNIYVFKNWLNKKTKIYEYLKKQLDIKTDIIDVIDMDPCTDRDEWLDSHGEETKLNYYKIEKEIESLADPNGNTQPNVSSSMELVSFDNEEITQSNTHKTERNMVGVISNVIHSLKRQRESSVDELITLSDESISESNELNPESDELIPENVQMTNISDRDEAQSPHPNKRKRIASSSGTNYKSLNTSKKTEDGKNSKKSDDWSGKRVLTASSSGRRVHQYNNRRVFTSMSTSCPQSGIFSGESQRDQHALQRLGEECVFSFLQDHYQSKHPNFIPDLSDACFTLSGQSRTVKITWLNEREDMGLSHDFVLQKDGDTECYIKVNSIFKSNQEPHFMENYLETENPEQKNNFIIYTIVFAASNTQSNESEPFYTIYKTTVVKTST